MLVVPTVNFTQNFIQTYQTVYENRTNETGKDQGSDLPIITGIAVVVIRVDHAATSRRIQEYQFRHYEL